MSLRISITQQSSQQANGCDSATSHSLLSLVLIQTTKKYQTPAENKKALRCLSHLSSAGLVCTEVCTGYTLDYKLFYMMPQQSGCRAAQLSPALGGIRPHGKGAREWLGKWRRNRAGERWGDIHQMNIEEERKMDRKTYKNGNDWQKKKEVNIKVNQLEGK